VGGLTSEGIGSFFKHIKTSAILAHYTHSNLNVVFDKPNSTHGYEYGSILRGIGCDNLSSKINTIEPTCRLNSSHVEDILPQICDKLMPSFRVLEMLSVSHCTDIVHEVESELHADFNDCMLPFFQKNLLPFQPTYSQSKNLHIGIHLRWGDLGQVGITELSRNSTLNKRSIPIRMAIQALENIHTVGCGNHEVKIYVKTVYTIEKVKVDGLPYRIVDTGDDVSDLVDYMSNDVLIQGESYYPVLAAFAIGNKIIRTDKASLPMYDQRFLQVNQVFGVNEKIRISCPFQSYGRNLATDARRVPS
jgi:hypothetical protein